MMRTASALLLSLLLAVTAAGFGMARGQARIAGEVVLCQNGVAVSVAVDAQGNPVAPPHLCPDCVVAALAALAVPDAGASRPDLRLIELSGGGHIASLSPVAVPVTRARDPPARPS